MYNPANSVKIEPIPAGEVVEGVIINIQDGKPRDFLKSEASRLSFKNLDEPCINITVELKYKDKVLQTEQIFSYVQGKDGKTLYASNSNMARYAKQYGHLPVVSDKVKLTSNAQGFFKIVL